MKERYFDKFIFFIMILFVIFAIYLQMNINKSTQELKKEELDRVEQYAKNISKLINYRTNNNIEKSLDDNQELRILLNKSLESFLTKQYKYIFILTKDKNKKYRFLLDGSDSPEEYKDIFFPKSKLFNIVYNQKKMLIVKQQGIQQIWLSLVYPIVDKDTKTTKALLVMDLSKEYGKHLENFHSPLKSIVWLIQGFLIISIILLIFLLNRYYKIREELLTDKLTNTNSKLFLEEFLNRNNICNFNAILIDIDDFTDINEKYGYGYGNKVLKEFGIILNDAIVKEVKAIRIGGTSFLLLLPKEIEFYSFTNNLFNELKNDGYTISMSAMIIPKGTISIINIEVILDEALLSIKSRGKNDLLIIKEKTLDEIKYSNIEYIKEALENKRFKCIYQPIYNTKTKEIVKFEALIRMIDKDNDNKLLSPYYFMNKIKGTSQYIKMSKIVLSNVFDTLKKYPHIQITMNLDLNDLYNKSMMKLLTDKLKENQKLSKRLTFEILEDKEIKDFEGVDEIFTRLKAYGSKIALDDFGSGFSNYQYLIKLNIDILKIDGSLIKELNQDSTKADLIVSSIQKLANNLNYELIAEFVSNKEIYNKVNQLDIKYSQGYYLGEPKPIEEYI